MWEKSKETTKCEKKTVICDIKTTYYEDRTVKCDKRTLICDIETAQCDDGTVKCEKKVREPPNVRKELSYLILELHTVKIESLSMRKKGTTQCDKRIVICNVGTA